MQRADFERKRWSYLHGEWRLGGWWYYYVYALLIKEPLGTWALLLLAASVGLIHVGWAKVANAIGGTAQTDSSARHAQSQRIKKPSDRSPTSATVCLSHPTGYSAGWRNELMLLAPIAVVLVLVSSQTGFNHHLRYVLPIFPFAFIWMSKVARSIELGWEKGTGPIFAKHPEGRAGKLDLSPFPLLGHRTVAVIAAAALCWSMGSSLYYYPHSLSYFNELVGGPKGGHYHLGNSNIDWGQDLLYLKSWLDEHPEATPLRLADDMPLIDPKLAGVEYVGRPPTAGPEPGWHAVSVNQIHRLSGDYEYFLRFEPVGMAGYSIYIYHITLEQANRVRRELGLPELPASKTSEGGEHEGAG